MDKSKLTLYLVTDRALADARGDGMSLEQIVEQAVKGGVSIVQLREKHLDEEAFIEEGRRYKALLSKYGVPLIINDNIGVALACGADGVHIGQSDMKYAQARALLGPDKIIGLSIETFEQLEEANGLDVDYVAASPVFSTPTKTDTARPWGLDGLREFVARSKHPVVAIGGINRTNVGEIFACGADGAAVVSAIVCAASPLEATKDLTMAISDARRSPEAFSSGCSCHTLGEFGLIESIGKTFREVKRDNACRGIGDDCAILPQRPGMQTLVSTDMLMEGTHFLFNDTSAWDLGWKSAAVNISDIAAMCGKPVATFLSCAIPSKVSVGWIKDFIEGYKACSVKFGAPLLGGDTTSSPDALCINVTVLGECAEGRAKLRCTARPGDLICVTGELGDSAGGLQVILQGLPRKGAAARLVERHYHPMPMIEAGLELAKYEGVHAVMDISDGIASDLRQILEASGVSAVIHTDRIPLSNELVEVFGDDGGRYGKTPLELAIEGGEDYHLLFTVDPKTEKELDRVTHYIIGEITEQAGEKPTVEWTGCEADFMGFRHF